MLMYGRIRRISWTTNNEVLKQLEVRREILTIIKTRQLWYFEHLIMQFWRPFLRARSKGRQQEDDRDINEGTTSRDVQETDWPSALRGAENRADWFQWISQPSARRHHQMMMRWWVAAELNGTIYVFRSSVCCILVLNIYVLNLWIQ